MEDPHEASAVATPEVPEACASASATEGAEAEAQSANSEEGTEPVGRHDYQGCATRTEAYLDALTDVPIKELYKKLRQWEAQGMSMTQVEDLKESLEARLVELRKDMRGAPEWELTSLVRNYAQELQGKLDDGWARHNEKVKRLLDVDNLVDATVSGLNTTYTSFLESDSGKTLEAALVNALERGALKEVNNTLEQIALYKFRSIVARRFFPGLVRLGVAALIGATVVNALRARFSKLFPQDVATRPTRWLRKMGAVVRAKCAVFLNIVRREKLGASLGVLLYIACGR